MAFRFEGHVRFRPLDGTATDHRLGPLGTELTRTIGCVRAHLKTFPSLPRMPHVPMRGRGLIRSASMTVRFQRLGIRLPEVLSSSTLVLREIMRPFNRLLRLSEALSDLS